MKQHQQHQEKSLGKQLLTKFKLSFPSVFSILKALFKNKI